MKDEIRGVAIEGILRKLLESMLENEEASTVTKNTIGDELARAMIGDDKEDLPDEELETENEYEEMMEPERRQPWKKPHEMKIAFAQIEALGKKGKKNKKMGK